jgi:hypothetical protein
MRRIVNALSALACAAAVAGLVGVAEGTVAQGAKARSVSVSASAALVSRTAVENESAAQSDAPSLLAELALPAGASQSSVEPAGDDSLLAHPGVGPPATPNVVDDRAWWIVPGTPAEVLAYIRAHLPAGTTPAVTDGGLSGPNVPGNESEAFAWPPIAGVLATRWLVVEVVQLPSGSTGLRADAQVVWVTPRPASETIPPGSHLLRISVHGSLRGERPKQHPFSVTSAKKIDAIVALLNALPASQPGTRSCPADFGIRVRLAFYSRRGIEPLAVATIDPQGCGGVALTIGGAAQPGLESGGALGQVEHVLGVKLDTRP